MMRPHNMVPRACRSISCGEMFTPKDGGYNAQYCSPKCKTRAGHERQRLRRQQQKESDPQGVQDRRRASWDKTKRNPKSLEKHRASGRRGKSKVRQWLADYKMKMGCVDCGYRKHFSALQLDHEGPKSVEISEIRSSIARLQKEIKDGQCKVRCANCHSIKTWERKQPGYIEFNKTVSKIAKDSFDVV